MSELLWKNSFLFCLSAEKLQIQLCKQLNRYHQARNGFHTVFQKCVCELNVQLCFFPGKEKNTEMVKDVRLVSKVTTAHLKLYTCHACHIPIHFKLFNKNVTA